jgi:hypothetical protein
VVGVRRSYLESPLGDQETPRIFRRHGPPAAGVHWVMESYKRGSHTVWNCKYHVVWVTNIGSPSLGAMWGSDAVS